MFLGRLINKKLQKRGDLLIQQSASLMMQTMGLLDEMVQALVQGDVSRLSELDKQVIKLERKADNIKDELIREVLTKRAYLKQGARDRHELIIRIDKILSRVEHAARMMESLHVTLDVYQKELFKTLSRQIKDTVARLEEAIKLLWVDYKEAQELTRKVEESRELARDTFYQLLRAIRDAEDSSHASFLLFIAESLIQIAVSAEVGADHVRAIIIRSY